MGPAVAPVDGGREERVQQTLQRGTDSAVFGFGGGRLRPVMLCCYNLSIFPCQLRKEYLKNLKNCLSVSTRRRCGGVRQRTPDTLMRMMMMMKDDVCVPQEFNEDERQQIMEKNRLKPKTPLRVERNNPLECVLVPLSAQRRDLVPGFDSDVK